MGSNGAGCGSKTVSAAAAPSKPSLCERVVDLYQIVVPEASPAKGYAGEEAPAGPSPLPSSGKRHDVVYTHRPPSKNQQTHAVFTLSVVHPAWTASVRNKEVLDGYRSVQFMLRMMKQTYAQLFVLSKATRH